MVLWYYGRYTEKPGGLNHNKLYLDL